MHPSVEIDRATQDAEIFGIGWLRVYPDGSFERVHPHQVQDHGDHAPIDGSDGLGMPWGR